MAWELGWQEQSPQRTQSCDMGPWTPGLQSRGQSFVSSPLVVVGTGTPAFLQATPLLASRGSLSLSPPQRRVPPALSTEHRAVTTPACLPCQQFRHLPSSPHLFPTVSPRGGGLAVLPKMGPGPTLYSACVVPSWLSSVGCSVTSDTLLAGVLWHHLFPGHPGGGTTSRQPRGPNKPCFTSSRPTLPDSIAAKPQPDTWASSRFL